METVKEQWQTQVGDEAMAAGYMSSIYGCGPMPREMSVEESDKRRKERWAAAKAKGWKTQRRRRQERGDPESSSSSVSETSEDE